MAMTTWSAKVVTHHFYLTVGEEFHNVSKDDDRPDGYVLPQEGHGEHRARRTFVERPTKMQPFIANVEDLDGLALAYGAGGRAIFVDPEGAIQKIRQSRSVIPVVGYKWKHSSIVMQADDSSVRMSERDGVPNHGVQKRL